MPGQSIPRPIPKPIAPLRINAYTVCSAAARGRKGTLEALRSRSGGLSENDFGPQPVQTYIGRVGGIEDEPLPEHLTHWDCRNNRLAWLGLRQDGFLDAVAAARERYGASRVAIVFGTSTSTIGATEEAYCSLDDDQQFSRLAHTAFNGSVSAGCLAVDGDQRDDWNRLFVERQGVCGSRTTHQEWAGRCGRRRRNRLALRQCVVRVQFAGPDIQRPLPAFRRGTQRYQSWRGCRLRADRA